MNINNTSKERFLKAKKGILKKYPNAKTMMDSEGKYYVATENGRDICNIQVGNTLNNFNFDKTENCDTNYEMQRFNSVLNNIDTKLQTIAETKQTMEDLQGDMVDFKNLFNNRSDRGKFGEEYLEDLVRVPS